MWSRIQKRRDDEELQLPSCLSLPRWDDENRNYRFQLGPQNYLGRIIPTLRMLKNRLKVNPIILFSHFIVRRSQSIVYIFLIRPFLPFFIFILFYTISKWLFLYPTRICSFSQLFKKNLHNFYVITVHWYMPIVFKGKTSRWWHLLEELSSPQSSNASSTAAQKNPRRKC